MQFLAFSLLILCAYSVATPACEDGTKTRVDSDCTKYKWCVHGNYITMSCAAGTVWNNDKKECVHEGSPDDMCAIKPRAHPTLCQQYLVAGQENECDYPKLFSKNTGNCEDFWHVDCGEREEPTYICDYHRYRCQRSISVQCRCRQNQPNCANLADGFQHHSVKVWSPYYVECRSERVMAEHTCPEKNNRQQIFHPGKRRCV